jgi:Tfp pilus assembly protein PilF
MRVDQAESAERMFQLALELDPTDLFSLQVLGHLRLGESDFAGAKEYFARGTAIDQTDKECLKGLEACGEGHGLVPAS